VPTGLLARSTIHPTHSGRCTQSTKRYSMRSPIEERNAMGPGKNGQSLLENPVLEGSKDRS
jgi:hypothetical protein